MLSYHFSRTSISSTVSKPVSCINGLVSITLGSMLSNQLKQFLFSTLLFSFR